MSWDAVTAGGTLLAAVAAMVSAMYTVAIARGSDRAARAAQAAAEQSNKAAFQSTIQNQLHAYLAKYDTVVSRYGGGVFKDSDFDKFCELKQRTVEICAGLLIGVVDVMRFAGDPRANYWQEFVNNMDGVLLSRNNIVAYAGHPDTRAAITVRQDELRRCRTQTQ